MIDNLKPYQFPCKGPYYIIRGTSIEEVDVLGGKSGKTAVISSEREFPFIIDTDLLWCENKK